MMGHMGDDNTFNMIQCEAKGLSSTQKNYSCYKVELTGLAFATKKCHHFIAHSFSPITILLTIVHLVDLRKSI